MPARGTVVALASDNLQGKACRRGSGARQRRAVGPGRGLPGRGANDCDFVDHRLRYGAFLRGPVQMTLVYGIDQVVGSCPARQSAAAIQRPYHPVGTDHAKHRATLEGLERRLPRCEGEGVLPTKHGDLAGRRDDGVVEHARDLRTWFRLDVRGIEMPREVARQALGFGLTQRPYHLGHW